MKPLAFGFLDTCVSKLLPIKKQPYKINQDVKKKYVTTDITNKTTKTIEITTIIGKDTNKNNMIFHGGYSKISFLLTRESKNKNIKNTKNGKNTIIPTRVT